MALERRRFHSLFAFDQKEGMAAFIDKRRPKFTGRKRDWTAQRRVLPSRDEARTPSAAGEGSPHAALELSMARRFANDRRAGRARAARRTRRRRGHRPTQGAGKVLYLEQFRSG